MKKDENIFQKLFGTVGLGGNSRVPLRSNIFRKGGYSHIGGTGGSTSRLFDMNRESPLLGNSTPSNRLSGYYERIAELKSYQYLDISKLATSFFKDYVTNFLIKDGSQIMTIFDDDGQINQQKTDRLNEILTKDLKIADFIEIHCDDIVFYGKYCAMLQKSRDDTGHLRFRAEELYDPISTIIKRKKNKEGIIEESYLSRGDDGTVYEIPTEEAFCIGQTNLRLVNDLEEGWKEKNKPKPKTPFSEGPKDKLSDSKWGGENREKVLKKESYLTGEPLFYSNILRVKELVVKELLVSLLSLRDLSSPSLYGLAIDKAVPLETANDLCAKVQKMSTSYNELASFLTAQFDATSFIENALSQNVRFFPDYNATIGNKNQLLPLDKLSDKLIEIMQTVDQCRATVLSPLGIPATIFDSASGSKWAILQQSERANSRVAYIMASISNSVVDLVCKLNKIIYSSEDELDPANVKVHLFEKSTVEYNNQLNQSESINALVQGISNVMQISLQTLDQLGPLVDINGYLSYIKNLLKQIDPNTDSLINDDTIAQYAEVQQAKIQMQKEQMGMGGM